ncbi:MAG: Elongation factor 4 [Bacteroidia bacterium]|nr:Elongation factor 4 [Bacteroidia bacterium]
MSEVQAPIRRLAKVATELNQSKDTILDFLKAKGFSVENNPNAKLDSEQYNLLVKEFQADKSLKEQAEKELKNLKKDVSVTPVVETPVVAAPVKKQPEPEELLIKNVAPQEPVVKKKEEEVIKAKAEKLEIKTKGTIDLDALNQKTKPGKKSKKVKEKEVEVEKPAETVTPQEEIPPVAEEVKEIPKEENLHVTQFQKLKGATVLGKMELPVDKEKEKKKQPVASSSADNDPNRKKKRKRIRKDVEPAAHDAMDKSRPRGPQPKEELTDEEIQKQIKETLARLSGSGGKSKSSKYRREKRDEIRSKLEAEAEQIATEGKIIKVTEFVTANELAKLMNVPVNSIISACMSLGLFVSINQRLDAETLNIVAEEFGHKVEFVSAEVQEAIKEVEDKPEDLIERPPIVTVMGHVDHGKTSLLDYIRKANVIAGEAGGITQHIGAYSVTLDNGKKLTFLDTPGHEAFTAMRARGAQVTDIAIIVVAADDNVMPQTREAINHAQAAGVPMVFAINKVDKPGANPDKIKEELANMNLLVEEWGGKFQSADISAKQGKNIDLLLEKVLLEAELLDLKANPKRKASGTIIESELDKGRGYVSTMLVETGTLRIGDIILAGCYSGRVKALFNERGGAISEAGPSMPVRMLGLSGAPQAGDRFNVMDDEREAKEIATKRLQLQREQGYRTHKHITLDEIGRRIAIGDFKELNVIIKGDVDGSVEALSDSLIKLSTDKIQVNIIMKAVGAVTESDVLLASASNAIIIGFQVRPSLNARKLAEQEQIDIRLYSIIYDAINELKAAMEGMLAPEFEEKVVGNIEVREVFKISKVGTVAGCMVLDGEVSRQTSVRVIRDGIVIYTGELGSLKRFKDDVKEVKAGYECGLNIKNFNDIKVGDIIEGYKQVEVKPKL